MEYEIEEIERAALEDLNEAIMGFASTYVRKNTAPPQEV